MAWGGVFLGRRCVPGRVLSIRRIRGWIGAGPERPRVDTRGYTRPLRRSSIRMACMGRGAGFFWGSGAFPDGCSLFAAFAAGSARDRNDPGLTPGSSRRPQRRRRWTIVASGGVFLGKRCDPERVLSIRRIRGWVGAGPERPRAAARGYPNPLLRSSIRMACRGRFLG